MTGMKVLVVGGGAREHALVWALGQSPSVAEVHVAPGNAGTTALAISHAVGAEDVPKIVELARRERYDLVVVGPEKPLSYGLADELGAAGITVFGCSQQAAEIESSKGFAKELMARANVPTAEWERHVDVESAVAFGESLLRRDGKVVVKADGLAAGKGVEIVSDAGADALRGAVARMLDLGREASHSPSIVVEEFLVGREASVMALCDGEHLLVLPPCEDHKTIFEHDRGPMTGGMGAISPTPVVDARMVTRVEREILAPTMRQLAAEGRTFRGLLYAGLMVTAKGPRVLEWNCRFGDPEVESLMARVDGDLAEALYATAKGQPTRLSFSFQSAATVVLAARGYPGTPEKGAAITGLDAAERHGGIVFHAGTRRDRDGTLRVDGGRVLAVTATGDDLGEARDRAYRAVEEIHFPGMQYRRDIGGRG